METLGRELLANPRPWGDARHTVGDNLIFIVGMPRCGSTLTEQILGSHPQVVAGGERDDTPVSIARFVEGLGPGARFPESVPGAEMAHLDRVARIHLDQVETLAARGTRFVDKDLSNFLYIGFLRILFPGRNSSIAGAIRWICACHATSRTSRSSRSPATWRSWAGGTSSTRESWNTGNGPRGGDLRNSL